MVSIYHRAFSIVTLSFPQVTGQQWNPHFLNNPYNAATTCPWSRGHCPCQKKKKKKRERERNGNFQKSQDIPVYLYLYLYLYTCIELQWIKCQWKWKLGKWREKSHTYFIHMPDSPIDSCHLSNEVGGSLSNLFQHWKKAVQSHWLIACNLYEDA